MTHPKEKYTHGFAALVKNRNFITFDQLTTAIRIPISEILELKSEFEKHLKNEDNKIRVTSRPDLGKPGFEIES